MAVCYKKLWKLLIDRELKKKDLRTASGLSTASMAKLANNQNVSTETLVRVCKALNCDIADIMEIVPDKMSASGDAE
jgi:DNA-binding Xre family transcriptional regulator